MSRSVGEGFLDFLQELLPSESPEMRGDAVVSFISPRRTLLRRPSPRLPSPEAESGGDGAEVAGAEDPDEARDTPSEDTTLITQQVTDTVEDHHAAPVGEGTFASNMCVYC